MIEKIKSWLFYKEFESGKHVKQTHESINPASSICILFDGTNEDDRKKVHQLKKSLNTVGNKIIKSLAFIDNNLYVYSASSWLNAINHILYSILVTFIFQGFLLNGLTKEIGFKKSNVVTSLFYGFSFGDILGGTIYNLFLNQIYWKTKNIFYPGLVTVIMSIVFIMAYLIKEEIWLLKADFPDYNGEIIKGLLITIVVTPIAIKVVGQAIKGE